MIVVTFLDRQKPKHQKAKCALRRFTCDFLSCRLGLTLRKPLAARDELMASPFLRPSVALQDRQEPEGRVGFVSVSRQAQDQK